MIETEPRRRFKRIPVSIPVRISTIDPETDPWTGKSFFRSVEDVSLNISRGGMCVRTEEPISPGQRVLLELFLPGEKPLETVGRVKWMNSSLRPGTEEGPRGLGLEFMGGLPEQFQTLEDFLTRTDTYRAGGSIAS